MIVTLADAYPELINAQLAQVHRETELRAARRRARHARVAAVLGRNYARTEEVR
ncbi:hypothetical protein [Nocardioides sp. T2.26MG-1]|uniref:hypothetical protein n=1 Tax=Nocardioides sp. T2.26MG-1 TaxID=3041166 RepID=UPI002477490D|nr:hypothetical protein [Nocardioides sp. T2.26MG-1]CAI9419377.1 hypothetical protein HIDPHFAB_03662 [Nocardioides sp. T2.26MG-1]